MGGAGGERSDGLPVLRCADADAFAAWLAAQPPVSAGAWLRLARKGATEPSPTRQEAIDAALCAGWIDGRVLAHDAAFFLVRFTPRRARSLWSQVNRGRAETLLAEGRVKPAGLAQIEAARADGRWDAAYPPASTAEIPADLRTALDADPRAAARFAALTRTQRYALLFGLATARRADTRWHRIAAFLDGKASREGAGTPETSTGKKR